MADAAGIITDIDALKAKMKKTWAAGDFGEIARSIETSAEDFIARLNIKDGERVLDVACGTGNLAIPAARRGAVVTGVDIIANLIEQARARAGAEGLECTFDEGDAEQLPYADSSFDMVVTMYGAMFAPRPELVAKELVRVCRPGGRIAMANWTPGGFIGQMFKTTGKHITPPAGAPSPILWGDEETVRSRMRDDVAELRLTRRTMMFKYPFSPADSVEHFRTFYGPTQLAFAALSEDDQAALRTDLEQLWSANNRAVDGTTEVESEYLEVIAIAA